MPQHIYLALRILKLLVADKIKSDLFPDYWRCRIVKVRKNAEEGSLQSPLPRFNYNIIIYLLRYCSVH